MKIEATIHNANKCTFDGRDCWIAWLKVPDVRAYVSEHNTKDDALIALRAELQRRGLASIDIRDTTTRW